MIDHDPTQEHTDDEPEAPLQPPPLPPTVLSDDQLTQALLHVLQEGGRAQKGAGESPFEEVLAPRKRAWLIAYALCGSKVRASRAAGVSDVTIYTQQWRGDTVFQAAMKRAEAMAVDVMEDEAHRRAVEGWVEPTGWYKGKPGGLVRRFSDVLLIFKLKGAVPEKYKDRVEMRGALATLDMGQLSDAQVARIAAGEHPMSVLAGAGALPAGPTVEKVSDENARVEVTEDDGSEGGEVS